MIEASRTIRTTSLGNPRPPLFSARHRGTVRCVCTIGISFASLLVGPNVFPKEEPKSTQQEKSSEIIRFHLLDEGSGYGTTKRMRVSFSRFEAEDGVTVERRIETYPSPSAAQNEMTSMVRSADKIIARTPERDPQGKLIGERFTLNCTRTESNKPRYLVLWKDGKALHILESVSLKHVLAFESQMAGGKETSP